MLKTLERIVDRHIKEELLNVAPLHEKQYAYSAGRSTEAALHHYVRRLEKGSAPECATLAAFVDIEGAFHKTSFHKPLSGVEPIWWLPVR